MVQYFWHMKHTIGLIDDAQRQIIVLGARDILPESTAFSNQCGAINTEVAGVHAS